MKTCIISLVCFCIEIGFCVEINDYQVKSVCMLYRVGCYVRQSPRLQCVEVRGGECKEEPGKW